MFFGAKGGAGTTTIAVNCGVELARLSKRADGHRRPEAGPRRGRAVSRRPAALQRCSTRIDNLHRLDREFLRELVVKHKSGLEILAGSDQFDRPGRGRRRRDRRAASGCSARQYEYIVVDAGSQINSCTVAALYAADTMFLVANPDVPSVRNAQRLLDRVRAARRVPASACALLLNRAAEPYPIPPKQIETRARPSDSPHVPERLQDGVDGAELRRAAGAGGQLRDRRRSSTASRAASSTRGADAAPARRRRSAPCSASISIASIW